MQGIGPNSNSKCPHTRGAPEVRWHTNPIWKGCSAVIRDKGPMPGQDPAGHLRVNVVLPCMATGFPKGGHVRYSPRVDGVSQGVTSGILAPEEWVFHRGVNIEQGGQCMR